jgi:carbon-monoxide dehydrogenase large subunit
LEVDPAGVVVARTGTQSSGQGHETVFADVVAAELGLAREDIEVRQGDTATLGRGGGTGGSSSALVSAPTLQRAAVKVIQTGTRRAAQALEAAEADIEYQSGHFSIAGTDRGIGLFALAARYGALTGGSEGDGERWVERVQFDGTIVTFPNGCQVAEVEVDSETGAVRMVSLISVDDVGYRLNEALVDGQMHGGIVQGLGQALLEHCHYDPESGQLLTGSLMDYALPRADDVPAIDTVAATMPTPTNSLGVKGVGELGTNGTPPAIVNAVVDALSHLGVRHLHMPLTSEKVWRAIHSAGRPNTKGIS